MHASFALCMHREACSATAIEVCCKKEKTMSTIKLVDVAPDALLRSFVRLFLRSTSHPRVPCLYPYTCLSLPHTKRTNFPSQFRRFSPSLSASLSQANISPSAASSSDRIEESSETAAISAEIESQNGENDCECFPPYRRGRGRVLKRDRDEAEY